MPFINVKVTPAITDEQKAEIIRQMTETMVSVLGKDPAHTHIVIDEIDEDNWGFSGQQTSVLRGTKNR
ncbi:MAG: 4-oxalocrotonate tautomerase family protein [Planctomycetota bacterium]